MVLLLSHSLDEVRNTQVLVPNERTGKNMFDVCVIGHVTKDIISINDREREMPGGTAYFLPIALKSLGMNVSVITKISREDTSLLDELEREKIPVFLRESPRTTIFTNIYSRDLNSREQRVIDVALPFTMKDVEGIDSRIFHLGPLTKDDIPLDMLRSLSEKSRISLDVQGFLRSIDERSGTVKLTDWEKKEEALPFVSILKADEEEARVVSEEEDLKGMATRLSGYGPEEVIITCGSSDSLIYSRGKFYSISSSIPKKLVDPTGCGDTYMAGYLFLRQKTDDLRKVGEFAARTASLKLANYGPFRGK